MARKWVHSSCVQKSSLLKIERPNNCIKCLVASSVNLILIVWNTVMVHVALRRFLHNRGNIATGGNPKSGLYALLLSNDPNSFYSAQYHRQLHYTLHAFEQFGTLYMQNLDDKHPTPPGFDPSTSEFRATTGSNEPSGPDHGEGPYEHLCILISLECHWYSHA